MLYAGYCLYKAQPGHDGFYRQDMDGVGRCVVLVCAGFGRLLPSVPAGPPPQGGYGRGFDLQLAPALYYFDSAAACLPCGCRAHGQQGRDTDYPHEQYFQVGVFGGGLRCVCEYGCCEFAVGGAVLYGVVVQVGEPLPRHTHILGDSLLFSHRIYGVRVSEPNILVPFAWFYLDSL